MILVWQVSLLQFSRHFFFGIGYWNTAIIIMLVTVLLDFSDGEISRLRKLQSKEGSYLDKVYVFSVHPILVAGISIGAYYSSPSELLLVAGFINTISISLLCIVIEYAKQIIVWSHIQRNLEKIMKDVDVLNPDKILSDADEKNKLESEKNLINKIIFLKIFKDIICFWDFPYIFVIFSFVIIFQNLFPNLYILTLTPIVLLTYVYAVTFPIIIFSFIYRNTYYEKIELNYKLVEISLVDKIRGFRGNNNLGIEQ